MRSSILARKARLVGRYLSGTGFWLLFLSSIAQGAGWTQKNPAHKPPARDGQVMVYDGARQQIVLFGGHTDAGYVAETWVWDGTDWTQRFPSHSPAAIAAPGMAYDAVHGQVVLFGGSFGGGYLNDTWIWSGVDWTQVFPSTPPPGRGVGSGNMTLDAARGLVVLFGGFTASTFDDTWTWDGTNWTQASPATRPLDRAAAALAFDQDRGNTVLFGGYQHGSPAPGPILSDTWTWDGITWTQRSTSTPPPARRALGMASDPFRSQLVLFGGVAGDGTPAFDDTWAWNGTDWSQLSPGTHPSARAGHSMAYDSAHGQIVLFGGSTNSVPELDDTWVWGTTYFAQVQQPINADNSSVFKARRGVVPVKFTLTADGSSTCDLPPATIALFQTSGGNPGPVNESTYNTSADNGSNFRITECQYIYNLGTNSLGAGSYDVQISIFGTVVGMATFGLN